MNKRKPKRIRLYRTREQRFRHYLSFITAIKQMCRAAELAAEMINRHVQKPK